jgi:CheY-like chemotaxis protein
LIFDEFRQVSEGKGRFYQGTGLGLTITKRFTELMNGNISVESTLGTGSTFSLKFMLVPDIKEVTNNEENITKFEDWKIIQNNINKISSKELEILYIEDDFLCQEVVKLYLKNIVNIDIASNAQNALYMLENKTYNMLLLDINLGKDISGLDVIEKIKKIPHYKDIPVVAVTAYAMKGDKEEIMKAGCSYYLSKPFEKDELLNIISKALS